MEELYHVSSGYAACQDPQQLHKKMVLVKNCVDIELGS